MFQSALRTTTISICVLCVLSANSWAQTGLTGDSSRFPYSLVISKETAPVFSGPGKKHYATDRLPKGAKVEIYREDPGGFLAIRPPRGSFSLVLASEVQATTDPNVVEVAKNEVKAWVGTRLDEQVKPMWQVKLKTGELLNVIKKLEIRGAYSDRSETWYQVHPPAGEFRWVQKEDVGSQAPVTVSESAIVQKDISQTKIDELANKATAVKHSDSESYSARAGWKVVQNGSGTGRGSSTSGTGSAKLTQNNSSIKRTNISPNEAVASSSVTTLSYPNSGPFQSQIDAIELSLSQMVLKEKSQWNLNEMEVAASRLRLQARTGDELAQADRLAAKIAGFQKVHSLRSETSISNVADNRGARLLTPNLEPTSNSNRVAKYDGQGVLRKLYSSNRSRQPIFALEDERGKILQTITPSSGVNLQPYVGKRIGLFGRVGFNRRLNQRHLTAERVIDLSKIR